MNELHCHGAFAHAGRHPLHRTVTDVARGEDARDARFRQERVTVQRPPPRALAVAHQIGSCEDEAALVALHNGREPIRVGLSANEDKERVGRNSVGVAAVHAVNRDGFQARVTVNFHDPRGQTAIIRPPVTELTAYNTDQVVVEIGTGTLLVFPAWLPHSVDANRSENPRISVSFNIMFASFAETMGEPLWGEK